MSAVDKIQAAATWIAIVAGLVAFGGGIAAYFSCRDQPQQQRADVVPLQGRRLHLIQGGYGELGDEVDRVWPARSADEMGRYDGLGGAA